MRILRCVLMTLTMTGVIMGAFGKKLTRFPNGGVIVGAVSPKAIWKVEFTSPDVGKVVLQCANVRYTDENGKVALNQVAGLKFNSQGALLRNCYQSTQAGNTTIILHHKSVFITGVFTVTSDSQHTK